MAAQYSRLMTDSISEMTNDRSDFIKMAKTYLKSPEAQELHIQLQQATDDATRQPLVLKILAPIIELR